MDEIMRLIIAEGHGETRERLSAALSRMGYSVYTAADGAQAISSIESLAPDAVVLSLALPVCDGYGVLERLSTRPLEQYPFIVVASSMGEAVIARALALGADEAVQKPVTPEGMDALLRTLLTRKASRLALLNAARREEIVRRELREIGMRETLKGFAYLSRAVALASADGRLFHQATGILYPMIADESGASANSVERAIRHAIEATWTHGRVDVLHRVFGNSIDPQRGKPTNSECIAMLMQRLRTVLGNR